LNKTSSRLAGTILESDDNKLSMAGGSVNRLRISTTSLFFDDIRSELGGKLTMVGHYLQDCLLTPTSVLDRLAIYTHAWWLADYRPKTVFVRLDLPGKQPSLYPVSTIQQDIPGAPSRLICQSVIHMRFDPLRPDDVIRTWLRVDDVDYESGRLNIRQCPPEALEPVTRH
jgi:hypothetical protein